MTVTPRDSGNPNLKARDIGSKNYAFDNHSKTVEISDEKYIYISSLKQRMQVLQVQGMRRRGNQ